MWNYFAICGSKIYNELILKFDIEHLRRLGLTYIYISKQIDFVLELLKRLCTI